MIVSRRPQAALRPFVERLWTSDPDVSAVAVPRRECVLPTGATHIAIRLSDSPLRLFDGPDDLVGRTVGCAVVAGARNGPYYKDLSAPAPTVGAVLRPGAAAFVIGVPASSIADAHTPLDALWGPAGVALRERLLDATSAASRLDVFEAALLARVPRLRGIHPAVAAALERLGASDDVATVVARAGCSHRHFIRLFSDATGLTPKAYSRIVRFGRAIDAYAANRAAPWADVAADAGYTDQPHFHRDFRAFAGMSPGEYRRRSAASPRHVPL